MTPRRLGVIWLGIVFIAALAAPILSNADPRSPSHDPLAPPEPGLPLGADALGRDFLARVLHGARLTLLLSSGAVVLTVVVGAVIGFLAAVMGGRLERFLMWVTNTMLSIPGLLLAMLLVAALGSGAIAVILAVGIGAAPGYARLTRSLVAQLQEEGYVLAAQASGGGKLWISTRHILPNALPQLASLAGTHFAWALIGITTLTFLGLAGDPGVPEWGALLNEGRAHLLTDPRLAAFPAALISLTILAVHALSRDPAPIRLS